MRNVIGVIVETVKKFITVIIKEHKSAKSEQERWKQEWSLKMEEWSSREEEWNKKDEKDP